MLRWFPRLQVATACFSCSPPNLNFLDPYFIFMYTHYNHCHRATAHLQLNVLLLFLTWEINGGLDVGLEISFVSSDSCTFLVAFCD